MAETDDKRWFTRSETFPGLRILTWQGKVAFSLYAFLVVVAIAIYVGSNLGLMVFVVAFYTAVFFGIVLVKSDIRPPEPPSHDDGER